MKYLINKKGFTLIELIIVLAIASIIIGAIGSFFLFNYKSFYKARDHIIVQDEIQKVMNVFIDEARETAVISNIKNNNESILTSTGLNDVTFIKFKPNNAVFELKKDNDSNKTEFRTLYLGSNPLTQNINITFFKIEPLLGKYDDCKGIRVVINAEKIGRDKYNVTIEDEVYFRNR